MSKKIYIIFIMLLCLLLLFSNNKVMATTYDDIVNKYRSGGEERFKSEYNTNLLSYLEILINKEIDERVEEHDDIEEMLRRVLKEKLKNSPDEKVGYINIKSYFTKVYEADASEMPDRLIKNWIDGLLYYRHQLARVNTDDGAFVYNDEWNMKYKSILDRLKEEKSKRIEEGNWNRWR